jgi:hypothetical protein
MRPRAYDWNTIAMLRRPGKRSRRLSTGSRRSDRDEARIERSKVVLPPDEPSSVTNSPGRTSRLTPLSTLTWPNETLDPVDPWSEADRRPPSLPYNPSGRKHRSHPPRAMDIAHAAGRPRGAQYRAVPPPGRRRIYVSNNRERKTITFCALPNATPRSSIWSRPQVFWSWGRELHAALGSVTATLTCCATLFAAVLVVQARASLTTASATFDGQRRAVTLRRQRRWGKSQTWRAAFSDIVDIVESGTDAYVVIRVAGRPSFSLPYDGRRTGTVAEAVADARRLIGLSAGR